MEFTESNEPIIGEALDDIGVGGRGHCSRYWHGNGGAKLKLDVRELSGRWKYNFLHRARAVPLTLSVDGDVVKFIIFG
uniref:DUF1080 domain-containing protein n=1 Tax=Panagrellus redivivus TaxID=6233 RepID=A0A7E4UU41_PANRE